MFFYKEGIDVRCLLAQDHSEYVDMYKIAVNGQDIVRSNPGNGHKNKQKTEENDAYLVNRQDPLLWRWWGENYDLKMILFKIVAEY